MMRTHRPLSCAVVAAVLLFASPAFPNPPDIPILVDGVPLDARAIAIRGEVYIPAWILENYSGPPRGYQLYPASPCSDRSSPISSSSRVTRSPMSLSRIFSNK